jgi:acyl-CoA synthetase (AMP-forming)/AMP-acid ligase II
VRPLVGAVWNAYGPTETTSLSAVHRVVGDIGATVPIGRPLPGEWVYVMDASGRLVPTGITGELWIGGAGLARGYRNRPELTRSVFVPDPFVPGGRCYRTGDLVRWNRDGELEYLGRVDDQIKLRGQRIELGEIEAVLHEHPRVRQAAVTVHGTGPQAGLVGYLAPADADPDDVARFLRQRLPRYMVPDRWRVLAQLPSTPSGKVDRRSLPDPAPETGTDRPPETDMERYLAKIWTEVLGATDPGRQSNFFALGGNSFAATRVIARIRSGLGCDLPVLTLFDQPSLAAFAAEVERAALARLAAAEAGQ